MDMLFLCGSSWVESGRAQWFEVSLTAIYLDLGVHMEHGFVRTRLDGSLHDGDPSIKMMPTSHWCVICLTRSTASRKNGVPFTADATRHDRHMVVISHILSACL